jgi:hypothetical protein
LRKRVGGIPKTSGILRKRVGGIPKASAQLPTLIFVR